VKVTVIGAGEMGRGIALVFAQYGNQVNTGGCVQGTAGQGVEVCG